MPAIGEVGKYVTTLRDATAEPTTNAVFITPISAANFATLDGLVTAYAAALDGVTLGVVSKTSLGNEETISNAIPSSPAAQRENKVLVTYWDIVTEKTYTLTIPTIDFTKLHFIPGAGDIVAWKLADGGSAEMIAWVDAFEDLAKAPDTGNTVRVISMRYVGRNT